MFYCAESQEPRAPRKMETPLSQDQWHVLHCRTTGRQRATPRKMETRPSEDQWHVLLCRKTGASSAQKDGNNIFWRPVACSTLQKDRSVERPEKWKHHPLKTNGMFYLAERQASAQKNGNANFWRPGACSTLQNDRSSACYAQKDGNATFWRSMVCSTLQKDKSLERPERWKHHFLKTNGMFDFAERQEPRAPRKMETPLSEAQWHVRLCGMTEALSETPTFDFRIHRISDFWSEGVFVRNPTRKHHFRLGTKGRCYFRLFRMTEALSETPTFDFRIHRVSNFWSEGVFVRSPTRKHHFRLCTPLGPL